MFYTKQKMHKILPGGLGNILAKCIFSREHFYFPMDLLDLNFEIAIAGNKILKDSCSIR